MVAKPSRFEQEARREVDREDGYHRWMKARINNIHHAISAGDVLLHNGVRLRYGGGRAEQIFCPFHGNTRTMAARYHPESSQSKSGVWCFACNERFDAIGLWKRFHNFEGSFGSLLRSIEKEYGIEVPEAPPESVQEEAAEDHELQQLFEVCESRLRQARRAFSLEGFLTVSTILEKLYHRVTSGSAVLGEVKGVLHRILDKIGSKERECPEG
mgnify:CR=1 FL=1